MEGWISNRRKKLGIRFGNAVHRQETEQQGYRRILIVVSFQRKMAGQPEQNPYDGSPCPTAGSPGHRSDARLTAAWNRGRVFVGMSVGKHPKQNYSVEELAVQASECGLAA